jgi:methyl-accepting chemotaxis protein
MKSVPQKIRLVSLILLVGAITATSVLHHRIRSSTWDARVVNHCGIVRGASQRYIKQVFSEKGSPELRRKIDQIIAALIGGDETLQLPAATDPAFLAAMEIVKTRWEELNQAVSAYQSGELPHEKIFALSEEFFGATNEAVFAAEAIGSERVSALSRFALLVGLGNLIMAIVIWFGLTRSLTGPLQRSTQSLRTGADAILDNSHALSEISQRLATGATSQAAALEETTSSLEEIAARVERNSNFTGEATKAARESSRLSATGDETMRAMQDAIGQVVDANKRANAIIETINGIAFQTNLLALNAAVEAARAGEMGAGFAIVAEEVRALAHRCAEAAQETALIVEHSSTESARSASISAQAASQFAEISGAVASLTANIEQISTALHEEQESVGQISQAMHEIQSVVQTNAAVSEEATAVAHTLQSQVDQAHAAIAEMAQVTGVHQDRTGKATHWTGKGSELRRRSGRLQPSLA